MRCRDLLARKLIGTAALLSLLGGCKSAPEGAAKIEVAMGCGTKGQALALDERFRQRAGVYELSLVGVTADGSETTVEGALTLTANTAEMQAFQRPGGAVDETVSVPLYGWSDLDVDRVNARRAGDLTSSEPMRPGVLVLVQQADPAAPPSVTLRFGSQANNREVAPFESAYLALRVGWVNEAGAFGGAWSSGLRSVEAKGYFCATPTPDLP